MSRLTREQHRALHAYARVRCVPDGEQDDYATQVKALGSTVLRNGLAAALAFLERDHQKPAVARLLKDLASAGIPGLVDVSGEKLPDAVRHLEPRGYMLATREVLQLAVWFRRAVQATFVKEHDHVAGVKS